MASGKLGTVFGLVSHRTTVLTSSLMNKRKGVGKYLSVLFGLMGE